MKIKSLFSICLIALSLTACNMAGRMDTYHQNFSNGDYEKLACNDRADNLEILIGAHAAFAQNDFAKSDAVFENFNARGIDPNRTSIGSEIGNLIAGQTSGDYKPYMMDFLFVSYYQIWDALAMDNFDTARVIINQSDARQQDMSREYKKLIAGREKSDTADRLSVDTSMWNAYSDIMNPALMYLAGIYFLNAGEWEDARLYLTRASGMMPHNEYIKTDLKSAKNKQKPTNTTWVFIESGYAPRLRETRLDIPWFGGNRTQIISVATAYPVINQNMTPIPADAQLLANVDSMFLTEFNEYQVNDALRAYAKAVSNMAIQAAASEALGGWGDIIGMAYSIATTNADVRSWVTLPQHIYSLRLPTNKSGLIKLNSGDTIDLTGNGNQLIYVRGSDIKRIRLK